MVRVQVQLTPKQLQALRRLSAETGRSTADLIREAVDVSLGSRMRPDRKELAERALRVLGRFSSGPSDVSENHDRYLPDAFDT